MELETENCVPTRRLVQAAFCLLILSTMSCDAYHWPPYVGELRSMFDESESVLSEIKTEMMADGLFTIGPDLNKAFGHPDLPELTQEQEAKYSALFEQLPFYGSLSENDGATFVSLAVPPIPWSRKSVHISYVHRAEPAHIPDCSATSRFHRCGRCSVMLRNDWYIEYIWSPDQLLPESSEGQAAEGIVSSEDFSDEYGART